jgi:hypothetical protein
LSDVVGRLARAGRMAFQFQRPERWIVILWRGIRRSAADALRSARSSARMASKALSLQSSSADARGKKPSLVIVPLRTETLQESMESRDLTERLAATLSRMRIASVTLAHPSRIPSVAVLQPQNAGAEYCPLGRLTRRDERTRVISKSLETVVTPEFPQSSGRPLP